MCGIFGIWCRHGRSVDIPRVQRAVSSTRHRGPDDEGYLFANTASGECLCVGGPDTPKGVWLAATAYRPQEHIASFSEHNEFNLALASRRLAILDLSPAGHQPMCNEDRTRWITHNGEIYNFRNLRKELLACGHRFISETDTEVILHAYEEWGRECLKRFNGMWAFAIWDSRKGKLFCSRDRFGVKPFYYHFDGEEFAFASEIKALLTLPSVPRKPNDNAIYDYLMSGVSDHGRETFFSDLQQLLGGEYLELDLRTKQLTIQRHWQLDPSAVAAPHEGEAAQQLRALLEDAVRLRLISDVSVGTCLSGGLDSSAIVCLINQLLTAHHPDAASVGDLQKTFSARYQDPRHDEGRFIETVTQAAAVDAHVTHPTAERLREDVEALVYAQDEPFGTTSIFAQWCVFELAQEAGVTVTLDGQGCDEMLAGYHSYFPTYWAELFKSLRWMALAKELYGYTRHHRALKDNLVMMSYHVVTPQTLRALPRPLKRVLWGLAAGKEPWHGVSEAFSRLHASNPSLDRVTVHDDLNALLYRTHVQTSLPALLRYEDRNSMAHSIESRVPFLDYRLVELVFSLPANYKIRNGTTKWIFREAMRGILPEVVRTRQDKVGFSTPEDKWFRGLLRGLIGDIIESPSFQARPYFDGMRIRSLFERHCQREINISPFIWRWVNLELWLRRFIDG
jgi:asparagine synthase (glutamine-hydrolysing)